MKKRLLTILLLAFALSGAAQNFHRCGTVEAVQQRDEQHPGYAEAVNRAFEEARHHAEEHRSDPDPIYRIPVVVHIVYNTPEENIPDEMVHSQIARLNKDYRRLNLDTVDTRAEFKPVAADAGIEFYLAGEDPDGNPTSGITRTQTDRTDFTPDLFGGGGLDEVKQEITGGVASWDTEKYLNIWVCDLMGDGGLFQVLGFAYPPAIAPNWPANSSAPEPEFEGVVVHYAVFGEENPLSAGELSIADKGRTAVHEVGHYLGLRHIWGDALFTDGCQEDDGIEDTPNASASSQQVCNFNNNTCVDDPVDFPDMIENYMDYAEERCMNMFTQGQVDIMRSMLETAREDLITEEVEPSSVSSPDRIETAVFPNPSNGNIQVGFTEVTHVQRVELLDLSGRSVFQQERDHRGTNMSLHLGETVPGTYLLRLITDRGMAVTRVFVQ